MAEKVIRVDDLDGSESADVEKRDFELLGTTYTIDLSEANDKRLRELLEGLAPYLGAAREVKQASRGRRAADKTTRLANGHTNTDVRNWATEQSIEVNARGAIPAGVYEQYYEAHPDAKPE